MGKRCETMMDGKPCPYLAQDGSCLLDEGLLSESCPALEKVKNEDKDVWMMEQEAREMSVSPYRGKE